MPRKPKLKRPLTLAETVTLLGAEPPENIGRTALHPLGMGTLAAKVRKRLQNRRAK